MSILMDSCAVMRGSKGGLETLVKKRKAPQLLNIDGDSYHHAHNACKSFCKPFNMHVEGLLADLHIEFKWSAELKAFLWDNCTALGISPTSPERYVPHRWLSVFNVCLDTSRLFDAYTVFYYSFLPPEHHQEFKPVLQEVLNRAGLSSACRDKVKGIQADIQKKWSGSTKEGKERKLRLLDKVFFNRTWTLLVMEFYLKTLPLLKSYVMFFQSGGCLIHHLHPKQHELFSGFCKNFLSPNCLQSKPHKINIDDKENWLPQSLMLFGSKVRALMDSKEGKKVQGEFMKQACEAYFLCAKALQAKMPINKALKLCSALDPDVRQEETCLRYLLQAPSVTMFISEDQKDQFTEEAMTYTSDPNLAKLDTSVDFNVFCGTLMDERKYPLLVSLAKTLMSGFHGPLVEGSFSTMSNVMDPQTGSRPVYLYDFCVISTQF